MKHTAETEKLEYMSRDWKSELQMITLHDIGESGGRSAIIKKGDIISYPWVIQSIGAVDGCVWGIVRPNEPRMGIYEFYLKEGVDVKIVKKETKK